MNAKEMFEELGFEIVPTIESVVRYRKDKITGFVVIKFDKEMKKAYGNEFHKINGRYQKKFIPKEDNLKKAIHQQMKELGWLDE